MDGTGDRAGEDQAPDATTHERLLGLGLPVAALFHLAGNPAVVGGTDRPLGLVLAQLLVGVTAVATLVGGGRRAPLLALAVAVPVSAWAEAPAVGNHWVLVAAVCLAYLVACVVAAARPGSTQDPGELVLPPARLVLIGAYAFAGFAKLNSGFMDPATSCAVLYQDQLVGSWGLDALSVEGSPVLGRATAVGAAAVELSVPLLLVVRRTRPWGVLLAMSFHWMLAMDLHQHFWDFSSALFVLFLLFLDPLRLRAAVGIAQRLRLRGPALLRRLVTLVGLLLATVAVAAGAFGAPPALRGMALLAGHLAWWLLGTTAVVVVASTVVRCRREPTEPVALQPASLVLTIVPALVVLNGVTPYLEIKTGYGWNMYSNLRTVAGETNHLLVPATWDLTGLQHDRVQIVSSSDDGLTRRQQYEPVWSEFTEYAADHPDETVVYRRGGVLHDATTLADDPATAVTPGAISYRLQSFRAVDVSGAERCLDSYGPAR